MSEKDTILDHFSETMGRDTKIMGLIMRDLMNREQGNVEPDTIGADYYFVSSFLTEEMQWDFPFIAQDFLENCFTKKAEYKVQTCYGGDSIRECRPENYTRKRMITYLLNGAKSDDAYCIELLKYLYKTYHKQEYKQLKRFRSISAEEIFSLSEDFAGNPSCEGMGRIITVCPYFGIKTDETCSIIYLILENARKERLELNEDMDELDLTASNELFDECMDQVERWMEQEKNLSYNRQSKVYKKLQRFTDAVLKGWNYPEDYIVKTLTDYFGLRVQYARTLKHLRRLYPNKEFSFEDVQMYAQLYTLLDFGNNMAEHFEMSVDEIFGTDTELYYKDMKDETLYKRGFIMADSVGKRSNVQESGKSSSPKTERNSDGVSVEFADKEAEYQAEIDALRSKVHMQESEISHLRSAYRNSRKTQEELQTLVKKGEREREELIALRSFVYNLEQEDIQEDPITIQKMKEDIQDKKIAVIGGHANWLKKVSHQFPNWKIIATEAYNTVDGRGLDGMDMVFFFTDHISHSTYYKYINAVKERGVAFSYLHGINMDQIIKTVYEALKR